MYESVCVVFVMDISIPPVLYISTSCMHTQKSIVYVEHMCIIHVIRHILSLSLLSLSHLSLPPSLPTILLLYMYTGILSIFQCGIRPFSLVVCTFIHVCVRLCVCVCVCVHLLCIYAFLQLSRLAQHICIHKDLLCTLNIRVQYI